jgi:hypothetical protein
MKTIWTLFVCALFIFSLHTGCSSKKESELFDRVQKEREKAGQSQQATQGDEAERERQVAIADECLEKFNACVEKCTNTSCESGCSDALSLCEKDLPAELKTVKK